jgi:hypothetical protein
MSRLIFLTLTAVTLTSCKTSNLIPGKFEAVDGEEPVRAIARIIEMIIAAVN